MTRPALTRIEATTRAGLLRVLSYDVDLDLTTGDATFCSTTTVRFTSETPGADTWVDLIAERIHSATLNGRPVDLATYDGQRLALPDLAATNELTIQADCRYSRTGEGLHRMVDPVDHEVYLYSQFQTADAQRVFACFDQPDLKSRFTFHVTAPEHWHMLSTSPTPEPVPVRAGTSRWDFQPTPVMSTYITAIVAGPYHCVRDEYAGPHGTYPMGVFCRASMAEHLDAERILTETKQGLAYFEEAFAFPYPFVKYDQVFVPEYNGGAMENAGCVTFMEDYIFRSRVTGVAYEQRANTILHELAHMWFGDLVTMRWWDDLWLNESFAEWASHHAMSRATDYEHPWIAFSALRKAWAYRQDQLPSTHPIATAAADLEEVVQNFDGITYAKGGSALRQLVAWVGEPEFMVGLRRYFAEHQWGNTDLADLLVELEQASGRDLASWTEQWLRTSGVTLLRPRVDHAPDGSYAAVTIEQEPPSTPHGLPPVLRDHRLRLGLYRLAGGRLHRTDQLEIDVSGASTPVPQLARTTPPDLLLVNDDDLTYAKIRLCPRSLRTVTRHLGVLDDPMARSQVWGAVWDMTRDAEISAGTFLDLVSAGAPTEDDIGVLVKVLAQAQVAVDFYAADAHRDRYRTQLAALARASLLSAPEGGDRQLAFVRAAVANAVSDGDLDFVEALLAGRTTLAGLAVDTGLRWTLLGRLVATGRAGSYEVDAELARDDTASGRRSATALLASVPSAEAKKDVWVRATTDVALPNALLGATLSGFAIPEQSNLYRPYRDQYFEVIGDLWQERTSAMASKLAYGLYPALLVEQETLAATDAYLASGSVPHGLERVLAECRDTLERSLRCRQRDAQD